MILLDEELLQDFVAECREHLTDIEAQLLALEQGGSNVDQDLVNKVFRAAHSIKGGAGLLNLSKLKDLAHRTENVLGQVRSGDLLPTPEVVNILLLAFDRLRDLVNHLQDSDLADISDVAAALTGLTSSSLPVAEKHTVARAVEVQVPDSSPRTSIRASMFDLARAQRDRQIVYLLEFDLPSSAGSAEPSPLALLGELGSRGTILDCTLEGPGDASAGPVVRVLLATALDEAGIRQLSRTPARSVRRIDTKGAVATVGEPAEFVAPKPLGPVPRIEPVLLDTPVSPPGKDARQGPSPALSGAGSLGVLHGGGRADEAPGSAWDAPVHDTTLRVNVALLESLMNLAGDLVLGRNQLNDAIARGDLDAIRAGSQRMSLVTTDLQQAIVQTRLQPIGNLLTKFRRIVRDLSHGLDKEIRLEISGSEVEMDKAIIEGLSDPLTHMVRNAIDHGIESAKERERLGKDMVGTLAIRVQHEAGQVVVEIEDDGRGMDPHAIAAAAVAGGVVEPEQVAHLSHAETLALVFIAGVTTATTVTEVSGRGVGMDVVKSNIDRLSGKIEIESELGSGTLFRFKLPLTLAIIPSLLVSVASERFAIPQINLVELLRIPAAQAKERFERIGDAEVLLLRGELIPILHLGHVLGIPGWYTVPATGERGPDRRVKVADRRSPRVDPTLRDPEPRDSSLRPSMDRRASEDRRFRAASDFNVAVVSAGSFRYGLVVDDLHDTLEIVVKPLGRHLKHLREYAGATILGDGDVALILDVTGLADKAGLTSMAETARARDLAQEQLRARQAETIALLSFFNSPDEPCAVPLAQVKRVDHIDRRDIELLGGRRTIRYRESSLPLVTLRDAAAVSEMTPTQDMAVVVFEVGQREMGLLAGRPIDAVDVPATVDRETHRQRGILGSTIIKGQTTLIVDLTDLVEAAYPEWVTERRVETDTDKRGGTVLLAEDSDFFRGQVRKCIEGGGYRVLLAEDGQVAWEVLDNGAATVDLLVTDIEMPRLTGLQLTRRLRGDGRFDSLPVVALSSLAGEDDIARGMAAGVTEYLVKLDGERLLQTIHRLLKEPNAAQT